MIRARLHRLFPGYIPGGYVFAFLLFYAMIEGWAHLMAALSAHSSASGSEDPEFRLFLTITAALLLGIFRVLRRHPFYDNEYFVWLSTVPWRRGRKLPSGSLELELADAFPVLFLMVLDGRFNPVYALHAPLCFLVTFTLVSTLPFVILARPFFYAMLFGFGAHLFIPPQVWAHLGMVAMLCLVVSIGNAWLMTRFPWYDADGEPLVAPRKQMQIKINPTIDDMEPNASVAAGWPHTVLLDVPEGNRLEPFDGLMLSLLAGWYMWAISMGSFGLAASRFPCYGAAGFIVMGAAVARLIVYCKGILPPINLFGRVFTFRFIIPRHDVVYLPSLAVVAMVIFVGWLIDRRITPLQLALASTGVLTVGLAVVFLAPPSVRRWRLVGHYRSEGASSFQQHPHLGLKRI